MGVSVGAGLPPPVGEPDPDPDPDPEPGITGAGAPVHGFVDAPGALAPLDEPFGAEGSKPEPRLCL
jgi:hypothetical protein